MGYRVESIPVDIAADGTGQATKGLPPGTIRAVGAEYAGQPATVSLTVSLLLGGTSLDIVSAAGNTNQHPQPLRVPVRGSDLAVITGQYAEPVSAGAVRVSVSGGAQASRGVVVYLVVEE